jgi:hypothetical protein
MHLEIPYGKKNGETENTKLLQVFLEPELNKTLQQYCYDNKKKKHLWCGKS